MQLTVATGPLHLHFPLLEHSPNILHSPLLTPFSLYPNVTLQ